MKLEKATFSEEHLHELSAKKKKCSWTTWNTERVENVVEVEAKIQTLKEVELAFKIVCVKSVERSCWW